MGADARGLPRRPIAGGAGGPPRPDAGLRFGPTAVLTRANAVTCGRFALTVPVLGLVASGGASWEATAAWALLGTTDGLDGWLARRDGTTRSGAFLDPLADKFLTSGGLCALAARGVFPWLAAGLVVSREAAISIYRTRASRKGVTLPARSLGKWKTIVQLAAVGVALCPATSDPPALALTILWAAVGLTVVSGIDLVAHRSPS